MKMPFLPAAPSNMDISDKIKGIKERKRITVFAHNYQIPEVQESADVLGDSLELAKISTQLDARIIVLCGVKFMAETVKILSPQKKVLLPVTDAGCPLADTITPDQLLELKNKYPDAWVISYVNTSASIKSLSDVCCTSANAVKVVRNVPVKQVIFIPDKNLGWWVKKNVPEKDIILWDGTCYVHDRFNLKELLDARKKFSDAEIIVHPECPSEVLEHADFVCSTSGMLSRAKESQAKRFIIGTEVGLIHRLKKQNPRKEFYSLGSVKVCSNMKKITLNELCFSLENEVNSVEISQDVRKNALKALEAMMKYV
ncbi:MAG: quinolinate synthase NadA [Candidatus Omnitrophota bacterium]